MPPGVTVFDSASWNGIAIDSTCGGHGTCHKCKVRVAPAGPVSRHDERTFTPAQLEAGWRLACLAQATSNLAVDVPPLTTRPKAATVGVGRQVILRPAVQKRYVELDEPTLADQRTDLVRLLDAIDDLEPTCDLAVLRRLPKVLREADFKVTAVVVDEDLIDVEPGDTSTVRYAVAFDLGTTTVVATLLDVETGTPVAVASMLNKQQPYGGDVITRISATMIDPDTLGRLQEAAAATLRELTEQVCQEADVDPTHVYEVALAGNATMTALALGIDPEPLGVAPFVMTTATPPTVLASELGLAVHPRARAAIFPSLGAYVGGDIVAGMLATGMDRDKRTRLFVDVGTNCEIVLSDGDTVLATAAPAGPAFEGGAIRCGMRAADGAIEVVKLGDSDDPVELGVIGDVEPRGLCGSGLVDVVAELVRLGLLDSSGRFVPDHVAAEKVPALADRLTRIGEERVFVLHRAHAGGRALGDASTCRSATSASCSSRRPRSPRAGRCCSSSSACSTTTSSRCCWPGRSAPTSHPPPRSGSAWCRSCRCCASSPPATSPARARRWPCCRCASAPAPTRCWRRWSMSSSAIARTSTTVSSSSSPSTGDGRIALIACGALSQPAADLVAAHGWPVDVHPLPPLLHNQPHLIADEVRTLATSLLVSGSRVVIGYADCGTYGALDEVCRDLGLERLPGLHCYDVFAGPDRLAKFFEEQPGTYVLTDFLVRSFSRTVVRELGLDRYPELRDDYFGSYTRVVWLAQRPDPELQRRAEEAAATLGLPLTVVETGNDGLERALADLVS